jgi:hypothetical protein
MSLHAPSSRIYPPPCPQTIVWRSVFGRRLSVLPPRAPWKCGLCRVCFGWVEGGGGGQGQPRPPLPPFPCPAHLEFGVTHVAFQLPSRTPPLPSCFPAAIPLSSVALFCETGTPLSLSAPAVPHAACHAPCPMPRAPSSLPYTHRWPSTPQVLSLSWRVFYDALRVHHLGSVKPVVLHNHGAVMSHLTQLLGLCTEASR